MTKRTLHPAACYTVGQHSAVSVAVLASQFISSMPLWKCGQYLNREVLLMQKLLLIIIVHGLLHFPTRFHQALFSSLLKNSHHVLHRLLPAKSTQPYNLRRRRHSFSLTQKQSSYDDCNLITRMLFYHIYWLNVTAYIMVPLCGVSYVIIKRIYACM